MNLLLRLKWVWYGYRLNLPGDKLGLSGQLSGSSMSGLSQVGSIPLVITAHERVVLVYAGAVNGEETKKATAASISALEVNKIEILVLVELVLCALAGRVGEIGSGRTVHIR